MGPRRRRLHALVAALVLFLPRAGQGAELVIDFDPAYGAEPFAFQESSGDEARRRLSAHCTAHHLGAFACAKALNYVEERVIGAGAVLAPRAYAGGACNAAQRGEHRRQFFSAFPAEALVSEENEGIGSLTSGSAAMLYHRGAISADYLDQHAMTWPFSGAHEGDSWHAILRDIVVGENGNAGSSTTSGTSGGGGGGGGAPTLSSRLMELRDARDNGLITDEEFQDAKKALIEGVTGFKASVSASAAEERHTGDRRMLLVDVGANVGDFTLAAIDAIHETGGAAAAAGWYRKTVIIPLEHRNRGWESKNPHPVFG